MSPRILVPTFMISELKRAFETGFLAGWRAVWCRATGGSGLTGCAAAFLTFFDHNPASGCGSGTPAFV
jgi:hypothetical protein